MQIINKESKKNLKNSIAEYLDSAMSNLKIKSESRNKNLSRRVKSWNSKRSNHSLYKSPNLIDIAKQRSKFRRASIEKKVMPKWNQKEVKAVLRNVLSTGMQLGNLTLNYENLLNNKDKDEEKKMIRIEKSAWCRIK